MNIVVLGGNCVFSSELSKALNRKLSNSVVVRTNLLNSLRKVLFPKGHSVILEDAGEYIGDVELLHPDVFKQLAKAELKEVTKRLIDTAISLNKAISKQLNPKKSTQLSKDLTSVFYVDNSLHEFQRSSYKLFDKKLSSKTISFFKNVHIFSGVSTTEMLEEYKTLVNWNSWNGPTAYIFVNDNKHTWLDNELTVENIVDAYKDNKSLLGPIFNVSNVGELLDNKEFLAFVNYVSSAVEEKKDNSKVGVITNHTTVTGEQPDAVVQPVMTETTRGVVFNQLAAA